MTDAIMPAPQISVNGSFRDAVAHRTRDLIDPSSGAHLTTVAEADGDDVALAVGAATDAFPAWSRTTPGERAATLNALADALAGEREQLARLEAINAGKPFEAACFEIDFAVDNLRFFAGAARTRIGQAADEYSPAHSSMMRREPVGVVGAIAPWNYPLMMAIWKAGPALAAGNCVVLKPAELTPLTGLRLAALAHDIVPPGVLNVVTGGGTSVGRSIVEHKDVAMVTLTGSTATGRAVAALAAERLARTHLELGGKAPVLVYADADLDALVATVTACGFGNAGQDCTAACRVLVDGSLYDDVVERLSIAAAALQVGNPFDDGVEMGPLISAAHRDRVAGFVERAVGEGAVVSTGGERLDRAGWFYSPTVVANARQDSEIVQQEVFGPVISVQRVPNDAQMAAWASDVAYGLGASVWTSDVGRAMRLASELPVGTVWVNDHFPLVSEMPHGGRRQSGYGSDLAMASLDAFSDPKHVAVRLQPAPA